LSRSVLSEQGPRATATGHRLVVSVSTFSLYPLPLRASLPLIASAGLDGVELMAPPVVRADTASRVARLVRAHGLAILSVHQTLFSYGPLLPLARRAADAIELAQSLGAPCVVVHSPHVPDWSHPEAAGWLDTIQRLQTQAADTGCVISVENVDRNPADDSPIVLEAMQDLAAFAVERGLGVTLDTCHAMRCGTDLLTSYDAVRERMVNVHLSDRRDLGGGERSLLRRTLLANHRLPGQGDAPLTPFLARLAADSYAGPVTIEVNPWLLRTWSPERCRRILGQVVAYIRQAEEQAEHRPA
jgi:sugar phosphate isomerase/epimerase